jgi:hypothetical protein
MLAVVVGDYFQLVELSVQVELAAVGMVLQILALELLELQILEAVVEVAVVMVVQVAMAVLA